MSLIKNITLEKVYIFPRYLLMGHVGGGGGCNVLLKLNIKSHIPHRMLIYVYKTREGNSDCRIMAKWHLFYNTISLFPFPGLNISWTFICYSGKFIFISIFYVMIGKIIRASLLSLPPVLIQVKGFGFHRPIKQKYGTCDLLEIKTWDPFC